MSRKLYLIDGHAQIYRAYYARIGDLTSPAGEPTRAVHVFCQMLLNLLRDKKPDYLAMTMDVSDKTVFRNEIYPEYKAQREAPPEDLPAQAERIVEILQAAGVPILRLEGFEADDVMATLAERFAGDDLDVYLVSKDKDLEQLLTEHISLYDPGKDQIITPELLFETKGWRPETAIEIQTLCGDTVDNIPGVPGVGPKTAAKLIAKYGSAQGVVDHADELTPKQRENVLAFAPKMEISRRLVTLRKDVPIELALDRCECAKFNWSAARPILEELGMRRLVEQLPGDAPPAAAPAVQPPESSSSATDEDDLTRPDGGEYTLINTPEQLDAFVAALKKQPAYALDTETTSVNAIDAELVGLSFSWEVGRGYYIPVKSFFSQVLPLDLVRERLAPVLADEKTLKAGHNLKYDLTILQLADMPVRGPLFDTMIAAFVLDSTRMSYKMDRLVEDRLAHAMIPITDLIGKGRYQITMDQAPLEQVAEYAAEDADYTWRLKLLCERELTGSEREKLFNEIEMPLVSVLTEMEINGISIDVEFLQDMSRTMAGRIEELNRAVHDAAGGPFNLDSPKQLGEVLFDKLNFRVVRKTKTSRSTDADTLAVLARETGHPLPGLMLDYREIQKLLSTYVSALPATRAKRTGRIHTSYHQTGAVTGRLSSSEPNLQNIPVRTELGREIRRAFVPRGDDETLIVADYSQIELRVLAHFSQDEELSRAFVEDRDIHAFVAAQVHGVELDQVTKEMRAGAKAVNFGIVYGQTAFGLSQTTGMPRGEAQRFIDDYFNRYPRIREFIDGVIADAKRDGYVKTILGRRRPTPDIQSRNQNARAQAERLAVNTVIQGSAADLLKIAMINLHNRIRAEALPLRMLLQVHDELVCETPLKEADRMTAVVVDVMSNAMPLSVPMKVDAAIGANWLEAK